MKELNPHKRCRLHSYLVSLVSLVSFEGRWESFWNLIIYWRNFSKIIRKTVFSPIFKINSQKTIRASKGRWSIVWEYSHRPKECPKGEKPSCFWRKTQFLHSGFKAKGYSISIWHFFMGLLGGALEF